jgi:hypothetical protein
LHGDVVTPFSKALIVPPILSGVDSSAIF